MPTYVTKIRKPTGETEEQLLTVPQESQLDEYLSRLDGFVIDCNPYQTQTTTVRTSRSMSLAVERGRDSSLRSRSADLVLFSRYLYTLVHSGVPLARALEIVRGQVEGPAWERVIKSVIASLEKGNSFADSLRRFPRFFPAHFSHLVDVGEMSGNLDRVLEQLADHGERQMENASRLKGVLAYPAILVLACGAATIFMLIKVLPRISKMFGNLGLELPWITKALLKASELLTTGLPYLGGAIAVLVAGVIAAASTESGRRLFGLMMLHAPLIGPLYRKLVFGRFCQTLALLQTSGVSLLVGMQLARDGVRNPTISEFFAEVEKNLQEGAALGEELARCPYVPQMVSSMITVGEETGNLSDMLNNVSRFYDREIQQTIRTLPKVLEPAVIVLMTAVVGTIAASVFLPLASMTKGLG